MMPNKTISNIRKVQLEAKLLSDVFSDIRASAELLLLPPIQESSRSAQLQITTSTKRPLVGGSIILHVRSNFELGDFHCVVTSMGRLLTTRLVSMGNTRLKTFDELVNFKMAPEATFVIWHVDNWGRIVSASVTVPIFSYVRGHLDALPVMEGNSGYTELRLVGEPNSFVLLNAMEASLKSRLIDDKYPFDPVASADTTINSNGLTSPNLIVLLDRPEKSFGGGKNSGDKCSDRGLFQCSRSEQCYDFLSICDHVCDCPGPGDCSDELNCGGSERNMEAFASPVISEQSDNDFWKVVRIPTNGSLSLRIPFLGVNGRLFVSANAIGTRGVANLGSRIVKIGTDVRFHMELPARAFLGEQLSIRITGINDGGITVKRTFSIYSESIKSFSFLSANGLNMVIN
jgi:hypothetical protein